MAYLRDFVNVSFIGFGLKRHWKDGVYANWDQYTANWSRYIANQGHKCYHINPVIDKMKQHSKGHCHFNNGGEINRLIATTIWHVVTISQFIENLRSFGQHIAHYVNMADSFTDLKSVSYTHLTLPTKA